jgi:hypothetical protein
MLDAGGVSDDRPAPVCPRDELCVSDVPGDGYPLDADRLAWVKVVMVTGCRANVSSDSRIVTR